MVDDCGAGRGHLAHRADRRGQATAVQSVGVREDRRPISPTSPTVDCPSTSSPGGSCPNWRAWVSTLSTTMTGMRTHGSGLTVVTELWAGKHVAIGDRGGQPALIRPAPADPPPCTSAANPSRAERSPPNTRMSSSSTADPCSTPSTSSRICALGRETVLPLRFGLSAFVIARETEAEAIAELDYLQSLDDAETPARDLGGHRPEDSDVQSALGHQAHRVQRRHAGRSGRQLRPDRSNASTCSTTPASNCSCSSSNPSSPKLDRFADKIIPNFR